MKTIDSLRRALVGAPLLLLAGFAGRYDLPCYYTPSVEVDPSMFLREHQGCARLDAAGEPTIAPRHLEAADYEDGFASLLIAHDWYYVRPDGTSLRVITYDNGPDYWAEGLVRVRRDGKIAYADRDLQVVIPPRYDWGWPFEGGRALVCSGCSWGEPVGEHRFMEGGHWGYIDRSGHEIVPVRLTRDEALELAPEPVPPDPASGGERWTAEDLEALRTVVLEFYRTEQPESWEALATELERGATFLEGELYGGSPPAIGAWQLRDDGGRLALVRQPPLPREVPAVLVYRGVYVTREAGAWRVTGQYFLVEDLVSASDD